MFLHCHPFSETFHTINCVRRLKTKLALPSVFRFERATCSRALKSAALGAASVDRPSEAPRLHTFVWRGSAPPPPPLISTPLVVIHHLPAPAGALTVAPDWRRTTAMLLSRPVPNRGLDDAECGTWQLTELNCWVWITVTRTEVSEAVPPRRDGRHALAVVAVPSTPFDNRMYLDSFVRAKTCFTRIEYIWNFWLCSPREIMWTRHYFLVILHSDSLYFHVSGFDIYLWRLRCKKKKADRMNRSCPFFVTIELFGLSIHRNFRFVI